MAKQATLTASKGGATTEKKFTFHQMFGMLRAFDVLSRSNVQVPAKVDYWLHKNVKILQKAYNDAMDERELVLKEFAHTYTHKEVINHKETSREFILVKGKDDTDTLLKNNFGFFKLVDDKLVQIPHDANGMVFWDKVTPAAEAKEAVIGGGIDGTDIPAVEAQPEKTEKIAYNFFWLTPESETAFLNKLTEIQNGENYSLDLYPLKAENLNGLNVIKRGENKEPLEEYIKLIYDYCVID